MGSSDLPPNMTDRGVVSVAGLTDYLKALIEEDEQLTAIAVFGEVSSANQSGSGLFFTLRDPDSDAKLNAVLWRYLMAQQPVLPQTGQQILVLGKLQVYAPRSDYKIIADRILPLGDGLQALKQQQLRDRLRAEGLFDADRKRPLPSHPQTIGVISSPQAAGWGDIQRTIAQCYPGLQILFSPAIVQGDLAPASIVQAFARLKADGRSQVVILARGGGSKEDLAAFDDERIVRAIVESPVPVVTGIGHQRDESLADLVADWCAHTPTAAAERVVPNVADLMSDLQQQRSRLSRSCQIQLDRQRQRLDRVNADSIARQMQQRLDREHTRLRSASDRVQFALRTRLDREQRQCEALRDRLAAIDPRAVLRRGYAVVRDPAGSIVRSAQTVTPGDRLVVQLGDGVVQVDVVAINANSSKRLNSQTKSGLTSGDHKKLQ
jgi:exodeoxyribonuclease VII large subunit